jgi:hypothetical protein
VENALDPNGPGVPQLVAEGGNHIRKIVRGGVKSVVGVSNGGQGQEGVQASKEKGNIGREPIVKRVPTDPRAGGTVRLVQAFRRKETKQGNIVPLLDELDDLINANVPPAQAEAFVGGTRVEDEQDFHRSPSPEIERDRPQELRVPPDRLNRKSISLNKTFGIRRDKTK